MGHEDRLDTPKKAGCAMRPRLNRLPPLRLRDYVPAAVDAALSPARPSPPAVHYYGYARDALFDALRVCGLGPGDTVLFPAYICDVSLEPVRRLGLRVSFYPVSDVLRPDWGTLWRCIAETTAKAVMSVNFFGFPQPMEQWRELAKETGVAWINDNAHGYGSRHGDIFLEAFGDVSVTSMRKVLPLVNGACLRINRPDLLTPPPECQPFAGVRSPLPIPEEWRRFSRSAAAMAGLDRRPPKGASPYGQMPPPAEADHRSGPMGQVSRRVLARLEDRVIEAWGRSRRRIYRLWGNYCADTPLRPVFSALPPGVSPMVFPCYARSFQHRQKWLHWAWARNIDAYPWPSLPAACRRDDSAAGDRWRRLLCFPIHPGMNEARLASRLSCGGRP
ncbi:MAG: DegT/DnrJ/EryC1/StrS family aminotransferase [Pseudomonadota bacterium]